MKEVVAQTSRFSIALVNYKTHDLTKKCLELLRETAGAQGVPVWVVDNDSADRSTEYLRGLDWINLIERASPGREPGHIAHGRALDMVLERIDTEYLLLLHTDTLIYNPQVFQLLLDRCMAGPKVAAAGCVEQLNRGLTRTLWRHSSRFCKHYFRRGLRALGLPGRAPKPWKEQHLKSFCTLWNARAMKQHGLHFCMDDRVPGYTLQDRMLELGYQISLVSPGRLFKYLDHVQAGTVAAAGGYAANHRRTRMYNRALAQLS